MYNCNNNKVPLKVMSNRINLKYDIETLSSSAAKKQLHCDNEEKIF